MHWYPLTDPRSISYWLHIYNTPYWAAEYILSTIPDTIYNYAHTLCRIDLHNTSCRPYLTPKAITFGVRYGLQSQMMQLYTHRSPLADLSNNLFMSVTQDDCAHLASMSAHQFIHTCRLFIEPAQYISSFIESTTVCSQVSTSRYVDIDHQVCRLMMRTFSNMTIPAFFYKASTN